MKKLLAENEKKIVQEFAEMALSKHEIQIITGFCKYSKCFQESFQKGSIMIKARVRKSIITLAENGSAPAQAMAEKLIRQAENKR